MKSLDVTLVMCTCKRLAYFRRTLSSLRDNLLDFSALDRRLIIDDNSAVGDRELMMAENADFEFVFKGPHDAGHARSLNIMLSEVVTDYALYWEDDSLLVSRGAWLQPAVALLRADPKLLSVSLDPCIEDDARCRHRRQWSRVESAIPHLRSVHRTMSDYVDSHDFEFTRDPWPGYSLKPHLLDLRKARKFVGSFDEDNSDHMEYDFARRAAARGLHTAILDGSFVEDIGAANSAYVLNGLPRSYDADLEGA